MILGQPICGFDKQRFKFQTEALPAGFADRRDRATVAVIPLRRATARFGVRCQFAATIVLEQSAPGTRRPGAFAVSATHPGLTVG